MNTNLIIKKTESIALTFDQLQFLVGEKVTAQCKWIIYDDLKKFKNIEDLMSKGAVVILLQIERRDAPKVGHFIILLDHKTHYEHFDSYGLDIDEENSITNEHHLTNIFRTTGKRIVNNSKRLQRFREDINTCGRWCVARLLLKHLELAQFISLISYFKFDHDELISAMTLLLQFDK